MRGCESDENAGVGDEGGVVVVSTGGVVDVCLCMGCGGVDGEWVWDLD